MEAGFQISNLFRTLKNAQVVKKASKLQCRDCLRDFDNLVSLLVHQNRADCHTKPQKGTSEEAPVDEKFAYMSFLNQCKSEARQNFGTFSCGVCFQEHIFPCPFKNNVQEPKFTCAVCGRGFMIRSNFKDHMMVHGNVYTCEQCSETFEGYEQYRNHSRTHVKVKQENKHVCNICGKSLTKKNLAGHMMEHEGKRYECDLCDYTNTIKTNMAFHMKKHMQFGQTYMCPTCGKTYLSAASLRQHLLTHSTELRFKCKICNKAFKQYQGLYAHKSRCENLGTGVTFPCEDCPDRVFRDRNGLKYHRRRYHNEGTKIKFNWCETCQREYRTKEYFESHKCIDPATKISCPYEGCPDKLLNKYGMENHAIAKHCERWFFVCPACSMGKRSNVALKSHITKYHPEIADRWQIIIKNILAEIEASDEIIEIRRVISSSAQIKVNKRK